MLPQPLRSPSTFELVSKRPVRVKNLPIGGIGSISPDHRAVPMSAWEIRADNTLRKVCFSELLSIASTLRPNHTAVEIVKPLIQYGGSHVVVPIKFEDGAIWAARLANDDCEYLLEKSLAVLNYIEKTCPGIPAPRIKASGLLDTSKVGVAYLLLDWIDGVSLEHWSPDLPIREHRTVILDGMADCLLSLWSCSTDRKALGLCSGR